MIKKSILGLCLIGAFCSLKAQTYLGYLTDNYSGVHGVISNPANIVDSRFKSEINLIGASAFISNDYYKVALNDLTKSGYDFDIHGIKSPTANNNILGNIDVLGPSFMFNINTNTAIALFSRGRVFYNISEINGNTIDNFIDDLDENSDFNVNEGNFYANANSWTEIGLTFSKNLINNKQHFLKGGVSLKYLQGLGNAYTTGNNVIVDYDADGTDLGGGQTTGSIDSQGEITYGYSNNLEDNIEDFKIVKGATGFGADLGFVYEWRPKYDEYHYTDKDKNSIPYKNKNKYKLKFGLSITDIGSINYKESTETAYDITNTINEDNFENEDSFNDILNNLYTEIASENAANSILPTALHLNADWSLNSEFFINLNTDLALTSNKVNTNKITNITSLTPRFESKWFSFYSPFSIIQNSGFKWGAGLRFGPLYLGSGSIVSALLNQEMASADAYAGLKIPIYQPRFKDKDEDGVMDKMDECPKIPGPVENNGCPWPDTDGDTVLDKDDRCPEEAGEVENNGCPWEDTDGDSILDKDDVCPQEVGAAENNGCPWKDNDNDGVLDKDDACPQEIGTVANKGCPEIEAVVTEIVQKTLNEYAKTILFNSGNATIKIESTDALLDIIKILNEFSNAKFTVEGHTDSIGTVGNNQKLSESRAASVKNFLIEKGIDPSRLSSIGYGESKPIATNMYKDGRAQNRRVEINLIK
jgi:outer membrane protein OmpA-like peptidoglycan-associated protein